MIGVPRMKRVVLAVSLYTAVHLVLAISMAHRVVDLPLYLVALVLMVVVSLAILWWPPPGLRSVYAVSVAGLTVTAALCVLAVLPTGKPSYAMWYPSLVVVPLGGLAVRGYPRLAFGGALLVAALTTLWAAEHAEGVAEGLYRTVAPTAGVVVLVGAAALRRSSQAEVARAYAQRQEAEEYAAALTAREEERSRRVAAVAREAAPVLAELAAGGHVDDGLVAECALLEASVRDSIRGGGLVDEAVAAAARSARGRGVTVTLLDDGGERRPDVDVGARVRRLLAGCLDRLPTGSLTARLAPRGATVATLVVVSPAAAQAVAAAVADVGHLGIRVDLDGDEALVVVAGRTACPTA